MNPADAYIATLETRGWKVEVDIPGMWWVRSPRGVAFRCTDVGSLGWLAARADPLESADACPARPSIATLQEHGWTVEVVGPESWAVTDLVGIRWECDDLEALHRLAAEAEAEAAEHAAADRVAAGDSPSPAATWGTGTIASIDGWTIMATPNPGDTARSLVAAAVKALADHCDITAEDAAAELHDTLAVWAE